MTQAASRFPNTTAASTLRVSTVNLRLLVPCVQWLEQSQRETAVERQLTSLRSEMERARRTAESSHTRRRQPHP